VTPIQTAAHEAQIDRYCEVMRALLAVIEAARQALGYTPEQMKTLPAVAAAKELVQ
jgi:dihydroxyacetone kinase-like predicted kinase